MSNMVGLTPGAPESTHGENGNTSPLGIKFGFHAKLAMPGHGNDPQPATQLCVKMLGGRFTCFIKTETGGAQLRQRMEL